MKTTLWLVCGSLLCSGVLAQQATNVPAPLPLESSAGSHALTNAAPAPVMDSTVPSTPAPKPKAPAASSAKKSSTAKKKVSAKSTAKATPKAPVKKPAFAPLKTTPLHPGPATVIASNVNVRGQATLKGEVVGRLTKGQDVVVLEEVTLKTSAPDEPSAWAKIQLPPGTHVWVHSMFIDSDSKKVKPKKLNVRGGPGENYSVLGLLEQGETVTEHQAKGDWLEINPPATAYAFVAAQYLSQEAETTVASTPPPTTPPLATTTEPTPTPETVQPPATTNAVAEAPTVAAAPTEPPPVTPSSEPIPTPATTPADTNAPAMASTGTEPAEEEPPPRIVQREGVVRGSGSIQAPTKYELFSPESRRVINYLYIDEKDLDLSRYKGLRIIATGEEGLDERWRNTPVLNVQRIQVLE